MTSFKDSFWRIVDSVRGLVPLDELRDITLVIHFLKYGVKTEELKLLRNSYNHNEPNEFINLFYETLERIEKDYRELDKVFSNLNIDYVLRKSPEAVFRILEKFLYDSKFKVMNYEVNFETIIQFFAEHEGKKSHASNTPYSIRLLYKAILGDVSSVLDPTSGSGSLLAAFEGSGTRIFGQDINANMVAISRLRFVFNHEATLMQGNSLDGRNLFELNTEAVVINPPFNLRYAKDMLQNPYYLQFGEPPRSNANMLWLQLGLSNLKPGGKALVLLSNGSLSSSGNEGKIRRRMVENGNVEAIISLPSGLFTHTNIAVSIWVLSNNRQVQSDVLLIDIADTGKFIKRGLHEIPKEIINKVSDCYKSFKLGNELSVLEKQIAVIAKIADIAENDFLLAPSRYMPINNLELHDSEILVELGTLLEQSKTIISKKLDTKFLKKLSIRNLSDKIDQYEIDGRFLDKIDNEKSRRVINRSAILIAKNGEYLKPSYLTNILEGDGVFLMNVAAFNLISDKVRIDYLIQELNQNYVNEQVNRYRSSNAIPYLKEVDFLRIKVKLPSLEEQSASIKSEKARRFQLLAKDYGFEKEIQKLKEQQRKDLGSKKHNIMQHLNNVKSSSTVLSKFLALKNGNIRATDVINKVTGVTVEKRLQRLSESIDNVLFYVDNLTNEMEFQELEVFDAHKLIKSVIEKGIQGSNFSFKDSSDLNMLKITKPLIYASQKDFEELYNNVLQNAVRHGFLNEDNNYEFRYAVSINDGKVHIEFMNNGKPFPKGMGSKEAYSIRGEKAGETANTGEGSWKVSKIAQYFNAELNIIDEPKAEFPVGIILTFNLIVQ